MKRAIFITVRTASTRLPRKALLEIDGKPTIVHVIDRLKRSKKADLIVLCTTELIEDDKLCQLARHSGIDYFRGSSTDKLERWNGAARKFDVEFFVTGDGDDLFCEPELIDLAFDQHDSTHADFIEGGEEIICGSFTYGLSAAAVEKVCEIKGTDDTEMMWVYFKDTGLFKVEPLQNVPKIFRRNDIRMTLDYAEDFTFFETVFRQLGTSKRDFNLRDIVEYLDANPEVIEINKARHDDWKANQIRKTKLIIK